MTSVYLHGLGFDSRMWTVERSLEVRLLEFPGFGRSPFRRPTSLDDLADFVAEHLEEPADIIGFSLGSYVAQHLVLRHPTLVRSLVLACGGAVDTAERSRDRARQLRVAAAKGEVTDLLVQWSFADYPRDQRTAAARFALASTAKINGDVLASYWDALAQHDVLQDLDQVAVPTTVIAAEGDAAVRVSDLEAIAARIPNSRLRRVDGTHLFPIERPDWFAELIGEHMEWVSAGAPTDSRAAAVPTVSAVEAK